MKKLLIVASLISMFSLKMVSAAPWDVRTDAATGVSTATMKGTITTTGNVAIGTTTTSQALTVIGEANTGHDNSIGASLYSNIFGSNQSTIQDGCDYSSIWGGSGNNIYTGATNGHIVGGNGCSIGYGNGSFVTGTGNNVGSSGSAVFGEGNNCGVDGGVVFGYENNLQQEHSIMFGRNNYAYNWYDGLGIKEGSFVGGTSCTVYRPYSFLYGDTGCLTGEKSVMFTTNPSGISTIVYSSNVFIIDGYNVGIGTTEPSCALQVSGRVKASEIEFPDGSVQVSSPTTPNLSAYAIGADVSVSTNDIQGQINSIRASTGTFSLVAGYGLSMSSGVYSSPINPTNLITYLQAKNNKFYYEMQWNLGYLIASISSHPVVAVTVNGQDAWWTATTLNNGYWTFVDSNNVNIALTSAQFTPKWTYEAISCNQLGYVYTDDIPTYTRDFYMPVTEIVSAPLFSDVAISTASLQSQITAIQYSTGTVAVDQEIAFGSSTVITYSPALQWNYSTNQLSLNRNSSAISAPTITGTALRINGADNEIVRYGITSYGVGGTNGFSGRSGRGTGATPTASQAGDNLTQFDGYGRGATGWSTTPRAKMNIVATENYTDTAQGSRISFWTTPNGSLISSERVTVSSAGYVGIGTTNPSNLLTVNGNMKVNSISQGTFDISVTTAGTCTGNSATVTNGVYTTGSYSSPSWLPLVSSATYALNGMRQDTTYYMTAQQFMPQLDIYSDGNPVSTNSAVHARATSLNDYTVKNTVLRTNGYRYALSFNTNVTEYIDLGTLMEQYMEYNRPFSMVFWLYQDASMDSSGYYALGNNSLAYKGIAMEIVNKVVYLRISQGQSSTAGMGGFFPIYANNALIHSTWNCVGFSYDGTGNSTTSLTCYINGSSCTATSYQYGQNNPLTATIKEGNNLVLGTYQANGVHAINPSVWGTFLADEIILSSATMSLSSYQLIYNSGLGYYAYSDTNTVAAFHCDEYNPNGNQYIYSYVTPTTTSGTVVDVANITWGAGHVVQPSWTETVTMAECKDGSAEETSQDVFGSSNAWTVIKGGHIGFSIGGSTMAQIDQWGNFQVNSVQISSGSNFTANLYSATSGYKLVDGVILKNSNQLGLGTGEVTFPQNAHWQQSATVSSSVLTANSYVADFTAQASYAITITTNPTLMTSSYTPSGYTPIYKTDFVMPYQAWCAFGSTTTGAVGYLGTATFPEYVGMQYASAIAVNKYSIVGYAFSADRALKDWQLQGSNDGTNYTTIDTQAGQTSWTAGLMRTYTVPTANVGQYTYYRLYITANNGHATRTAVGQIYFNNRAWNQYNGVFAENVSAVSSGANPAFTMNNLYAGTTYFSVSQSTITSSFVETHNSSMTVSGTIGIGTTSPTATLDVNGGIKCTSMTIVNSASMIVSSSSYGIQISTNVDIVGNLHNSGYQWHHGIWHIVGGTVSVSVTIPIGASGTWYKITNATQNLVQTTELDGFSVVTDSIIFTNKADYFGIKKLAYSGTSSNDWSVRMLNTKTGATTMGSNSTSTTGTNNVVADTNPIYLESAAGDPWIFQIRRDAGAGDFILKALKFYISYLHD